MAAHGQVMRDAARPAKRQPNRMSRLVRLLARGLFGLGVLVVLAWVFRGPLLSPFVRSRLEQALAEALDADSVTVGALDGDWLTGVVVRDIELRGLTSPLRAAKGVRIELAYDLLALLGGDLAGLAAVDVTAAFVEIDAGTPARPTTEPTGDTAASFPDLLRIAAQGVRVHVDDFVLRSGATERRGAAEVRVDPGAERQVSIRFAGLAAGAVLRRFDDGACDLGRLAVTLPGATLRAAALRLPNPWTRPNELARNAAGDFHLEIADLAAVEPFLPPVVRAHLPVHGHLRGTVAGGVLHLDAGELHAHGADLTVQAGALALGPGAWQTAAASLEFELALGDFRADLPGAGPASLDGRLAARVEGALADPRVAVDFDLAGSIGAFRFSRAAGNGRVDAHGVDEPHVRIEGLETPGAVSLDVAAHGTGTLPFDLGTFAAGADFALRFEVTRDSEAGLPPLRGTGELRLDAASVRCVDLAFAAGEASLRGEVSVGAALGTLLGPQPPDASLQVRLAMADFDVEGLAAPFAGRNAVCGTVRGHVHADGTLFDPRPDVRLEWRGASLGVPGAPSLEAGTVRIDVTARGEATALELAVLGSLGNLGGGDRALDAGLHLVTSETGTTLALATLTLGPMSVTAEGTSDLRREDLLRGELGRATVRGSIAFRDLALAALPRSLHGLGPLEGFVDGAASFAGPLAAPLLELLDGAQVALRDGSVRLGEGVRIEELRADLAADRHAVTLLSLAGSSGAGQITATGSLLSPDAPLLAALDQAQLELRLHGDDVLLYRGNGVRARAGLALVVDGTLARATVRGELAVARGSKFLRRLSVMPDFRARGGASAGGGIVIPGLPPEVGERIALDVALRTSAPFEARTHLFDADLDVAARLIGTATAPRLEGSVSTREGRLRFPGASLDITDARITFTRDQPAFPTIALAAEGKRMGILVSMNVRGPYDRAEVVLSSVPPLPAQDLVLLLSTGQLPSTLASSGSAGQARVVGGYLATEALQSAFGSDSTERGPGWLDRVTIETGREVSRNGIESIVVEYELMGPLSLRAERDQYEDFNLGVVLRFRVP